MPRVYPSSELTVIGYVLTVETRGQYATLVVTVPADSYTGKDGQTRKVPAQVHKFDVPEAFSAAVAQLDQDAPVKATGKGSAREYTDKVTGALKTFTSFRLTALEACHDLPKLLARADMDVPF